MVCLGVIPVKVQARGGGPTVMTYALLDNGSEVTLCHEQLARNLNLDGNEINFTLTGMTGSKEVKSRSVNIQVKSMDESTTVELLSVRTVQRMPISESCIPKNGDVKEWPHLKGIDLPELSGGEVLLLIGLKENPRLFIPLEYRAGGDGEPVAVRYSLGWTVMGPLGGQKEDQSCAVNFLRTQSNPSNQDLRGIPRTSEEGEPSSSSRTSSCSINLRDSGRQISAIQWWKRRSQPQRKM